MALPLIAIVAGAFLYKWPALRSTMTASNWWWSVAIPFYCFAPLFAALFCISRGQRRIKHAVLAAHGRACINCVYDLRGLGDTGSCPECGHPFDSAADRQCWARAGITQ